MGYLLIAPICFLIDQICKMKAVKEMDHHTDQPILKETIRLKLYYNHGAFLGFLSKQQGLLFVVNIISIVVLIGLSMSYIWIKGHTCLKIGIGFMTGGALSNIWDRLRLKKVVDYFAFKWKPDLIFNLADMFVFIGALLIVISEQKNN
ncbi:signal peptidase II [Vallitalea pronyensis]|uniref:Lipoprotein signal peptidase n=1 Tax=Vallitalea pronyensis TaxID=1348613 RepID=A0A8J8MM11_9FIRM|nr:signal peptidase II [Vallitalea pronyensis]QUI23738.1 signal peptidase II [Vallitalea pronyensis]